LVGPYVGETYACDTQEANFVELSSHPARRPRRYNLTECAIAYHISTPISTRSFSATIQEAININYPRYSGFVHACVARWGIGWPV
jgi:hypothetical protein